MACRARSKGAACQVPCMLVQSFWSSRNFRVFTKFQMAESGWSSWVLWASVFLVRRVT
uniref:Uncharacterized protein n=1 Tax=Anguilla anguilla TaxID=7936 RepID=A0A0E9V3A1_ANGAN